MINLGYMAYTLTLDKTQFDQGVKVAKEDLKGLGSEGAKTDIRTKTLAKDVGILGGSLASMGGLALGAGLALGDTGLGSGLTTAGMALSIVGGTVSTVVPALKMMSVVLEGSVIPALTKTAAAAYLALGPLGLIAGAAVVGGVAIAAAYMYVTRETDKLADATDDLTDSLKTLRYVGIAIKEVLQEEEAAYDKLTDEVRNYDDAIKIARADLERLLDIQKGITDNALDQEEAFLDLQDAISEWKLDPSNERLAIAAARAQNRYNDAIERGNELKEEETGLGAADTIPAKIKTLEQERVAAVDAALKKEEEVLKIRQKEEEISDRIREKDFQLKLIEWKKEGVELTEDERKAFGDVDWMAAAMNKMPPTYKVGYLDWMKEAGEKPREHPEPYGTERPSSFYLPAEPAEPAPAAPVYQGAGRDLEQVTTMPGRGGTIEGAASLRAMAEPVSSVTSSSNIQQTNNVSITVATVPEGVDFATKYTDSRLLDRLAQKGAI